MNRVLMEALVVLVIGATVALAANFLSPRGLALAKDHFPGDHQPPVPPGTNRLGTNVVGTNTNTVSALELLTARLKEKGLGVVDSNQVVQLFRDPRRDSELIVFVDARNEEQYAEGHVPGAYLFNHYYAEKYLATVLPVCQTADKLVVYCMGGTCEDSEFAALTLASASVPKEKLFVYPGGFSEWTTNGLPVELGARKSGVLRAPHP